jgi:hypothetical protein
VRLRATVKKARTTGSAVSMAATQSLDIWPAHPRPLPDELLSSWLVRLAHANGYKTQTFYAFYLGREAVLWNRDLDRTIPVATIDRVAHGAALPSSALEQLTLRSFNGLVYSDCAVRTTCSWLLSLTIRHRLRLSGGLQFCSECLKSDSKPYFRRTWRMAWATACLRHGRVLRDRCPQCQEPVQFHRVDMGQKNGLSGSVRISKCMRCATDLADLPVAEPARPEVIAFQAEMERAATKGYVSFAGHEQLHSLAYFTGLRVLATGLARMINAERGPAAPQLEAMDIATRYLLMQRVAATVSNWPEAFVTLTNGMPRPYTHFFRDRDRTQVPLWLQEAGDQIRRGSFSFSKEERSYVFAMTEATTGRLTSKAARSLFKRDISRLLREPAVDQEDASWFIASIDQSIAGASGKHRRDLLRDKVLFVTARVCRLSIPEVISLNISFADALGDESQEPAWDVPQTKSDLARWMRWYFKDVRSQYRSAGSPWLFVCDTERGQLSDSLVSARFQAAITQSGISRRISNFRRWSQLRA